MNKVFKINGIEWGYKIPSTNLPFPIDSILKGADINDTIRKYMNKELNSFNANFICFENFTEEVDLNLMYIIVDKRNITLYPTLEVLCKELEKEKKLNPEAQEAFGEEILSNFTEAFIYFRDYCEESKLLFVLDTKNNDCSVAIKSEIVLENNQNKTFFCQSRLSHLFGTIERTFPLHHGNMAYSLGIENRKTLSFVDESLSIHKEILYYDDVKKQNQDLYYTLGFRNVTGIVEEMGHFSSKDSLVRAFTGYKINNLLKEDQKTVPVAIHHIPKLNKYIIFNMKTLAVYCEGTLLDSTSFSQNTSIIPETVSYETITEVTYQTHINSIVFNSLLSNQQILEEKYNIACSRQEESAEERNHILMDISYSNRDDLLAQLSEIKTLLITESKSNIDEGKEVERFLHVLSQFIRDGLNGLKIIERV